ncbi:PAS domain S-box protein [Alteromonas sp. BL110]|uniref:MHYT domain-containing protein n=1 Tax=Alteromonas sp. BL110 TaxID=1714845 RepID=UPI000E52F487|nr:MHYT domain-containing protein [Alteromonas sp. BL110]AXT40594.1 PAS domain S-box protein [Alteromonas sp. BL110]RKM79830.1 PAS domain S-box protein [Alteromonas sp. BL110]
MISRFFTFEEHATLIEGAYHFPLVILSLLVAVFASFMAFNVAGQAAVTLDKLRRNTLLITGSIALGGGIWSMHFLGMTAFDLCLPVNYDPFITGLSAIPGVAAAWVALNLLIKNRISVTEVVLGGVLMGAGIGTMHYSGMAAMEMAPLLRYDLSVFALSIVVAVCLAMLSLWIKFGITAATKSRKMLGKHALLASIVMGLAIAGMHYIGMAAARFVLPPGIETSGQSSNIAVYLAISIAIVTLVLITMVLGISLLFKYRDVMLRAIESERIQSAITDTAVDAILTVDDKGIIKTANPAVEQIYGYTQQEIIGMKAVEMIPHDRRYLYGDDFFSQRVVPTEQIIGTGREVEVLRKGGERIPVRLGVGYTKIDGKPVFVSFASDLRKRKEIEDALRESEAKFRSLISNIPGMAYRCLNMPGWPMVFVSDAVFDITGYSPSDFVLPNPTRSFTDLYHPDDIERISNANSEQDAFSYEYRIIAKSGEVKWVTEHGTHVKDSDGSTLYVDGFISDITQRRVMEDELKSAKDKAEQAAAARTAFLANMSHEIRTPMNAIIGFSDLMLGESLREEQKSHLTTINRSARSLLHLLNDILDSAKLDKGKLDLDYRDFLIREELDLVVSTFWLEAKRKKVGLILNVDSSVANGYRGVPERMRQVLNNLIGNAVKFTHEGEVSINVRGDDKFVYFSVSDTGIGMTQEQVERVFDPFSQADASMSRKYGGTGLGTTISKQLVELMGGNICVTSEQSKGTTFTFRLPLEAVEVSEYTPDTVESTTSQIQSTLNVLVVDDVQQNVELLSLLLTRAGHQVDTATDGFQALEKMESASFDVVLMDLQMPKLDGLEAAKQRRKFEREHQLPPTPIIALTASVLVQDKHAAQQAGMEGFANKPVEFSLLMEEVARVLKLDTFIDTDTGKEKELDSAFKADKSVLDIKKAIDLWGSEEVVLQEVDKFSTTSRHKINELMSAAIREDYKAVASFSHGLKGTSGNLCLTTFFHITKEIEASALKSIIDIEQINQLRHALDKIETMLSESPLYAENAINESIDNALLLSHLEAMLSSVEQNMVDEAELSFLKEIGCSNHSEQIGQILLDIDDFEFELAHEHISSLIQELK